MVSTIEVISILSSSEDEKEDSKLKPFSKPHSKPKSKKSSKPTPVDDHWERDANIAREKAKQEADRTAQLRCTCTGTVRLPADRPITFFIHLFCPIETAAI